MRLLQTVFALVAVISLSACTTTGVGVNRSQTPTEGGSAESAHETPELSDAVSEQYHERIAVVAREIRAVCSSAANQAYFGHTPCLPAGMTDKHLRDRTRITPEQKKVAQRIFDQLHRLNEETRTFMTESGSPELVTLARHSRETVDPQIQALQDALLSGSITWGEYNRSRLEIFEASTAGSPARE